MPACSWQIDKISVDAAVMSCLCNGIAVIFLEVEGAGKKKSLPKASRGEHSLKMVLLRGRNWLGVEAQFSAMRYFTWETSVKTFDTVSWVQIACNVWWMMRILRISTEAHVK